MMTTATSIQHLEPNSHITRYQRGLDDIRKLLRDNPDRTFTPLEIFVEAPVRDKSLGYSILSRLHAKGEIERPRRGLYKARASWLDESKRTPILSHGIHLTLEGARSWSGLDAFLTQPNTNLTVDGKHARTIPLGRGREVTILASASVEVRIACSDNPLTPENLGGILLTLDGLFDFGFWTNPGWRASRFELNRDAIGIGIDGASAVTLDVAGDLFKVYDKDTGFRKEAVRHNVPLTEVLEWIDGKTIIGNTAIADALTALSKQYERAERVNEQLTLEVYHLRKRLPMDIADFKQS